MKSPVARILLATLFPLLTAAAACSGNAEKAAEAYRKGDYATALRISMKLAEKGNAGAETVLGRMYANGHGAPQNFAKAYLWYRKAAEQGYADAQASLGELYIAGNGVPRDPVQAHLWFDLASTRFPATEKEKQAAAAKRRDEVASGMTPAQVAEAQRLSREWKPKKER
jgi:TPR repeat protein